MSILSKIKSVANKVVSSAKSYVTGGNKTATAMNFPVTSAPVIKNTQVQKDLQVKMSPGTAQTAYQKYNTNPVYNTPAKVVTPTAIYKGGGSSVSGGQVADSYSTSDPRNASVSSLSRSGGVSIPMVSTTSSPVYSSPAVVSPSIGVSDLSTPPSQINLPSAPSASLSVPSAASNMVNVGGTVGENGLVTPAVIEPTQTTENDRLTKMMEDAIGNLEAPQKTDFGREKALETSGYNQALKEANDLSNQITSINADTEAKKLSLIGQGRGIPEVLIGGQQAKLDREAAIRTMPLTAQYKAAVGLVDAAKEIVNNFVADERAYQSSLQQWQNNVYTAVYNYASKQQQNLLDQQKELRTRQYALEDNFLGEKRKIMNNAIDQGKGYLLPRMTNAKNYAELDSVASELGASNKTILENLQIQNQILDNKKLQAEISAADPVTIAKGKQSEMASIMSLTDSILTDSHLSNVVGIKTPGAWFGGFFGSAWGSPTGKVLNEINQLKSTLSLEARAKLKGSGAISDFEAKTLERSTNAFGTNLSNADAVAALKSIKGVTATAAGLAVPVKITNSKTGQSQIITANRNGINNAVSQGYLVEYQ